MKLTDTQIDAIEDAAYDADLRVRSYSGRVMFGENCVGLTFNRIGDLAKFFVSLAENDAPLAAALAGKLRTDSLGLGEIAYFPGVEPIDDEDDEDEE